MTAKRAKTPRTDAKWAQISDNLPFALASTNRLAALGEIVPADFARQLERDLAAMERRAMDCVALNERQAVNFAKCQAELAEYQKSLISMHERAERAEAELAEARKDAIKFASDFADLAELAVALGLLREVRDRWYSMTPYSCLKMDIDALLDAPDAARREVKKVCDYARLPHSGGGTDHGQVAHSKGGYNICVKCYDAIIEAEKRESAHYDAARREHGK